MPTKPVPLDKLKRQLADVDALIAEGVLKGQAARKAREELEQKILGVVMSGTHAADATPAAEPAPRPSKALLAAIAAFVVVFGAGGYAWLGNHDGWNVGPGSPPAAASADAAGGHPTSGAEIEAMIDKLAQRLKEKPDDADGWAMLARSYTAQGKHAEALPAYKRVVELRPQDAQALADYADGLAVVNNRNLEGEPDKLIQQALKIDPNNIKALALAGTVAFTHGDYKGAVGHWEKAVAGSDPASEFTRQLQGALNEARQRAGLPVTEASAAAPPAAASPDAPVATSPAGAVSGRVELKADVRAKFSPDDTVFIFARAASGPKMPLAILRKRVADLPMDFRLDDTLAMNPAMRISTVPLVVVGARISKSGSALPAPGDWQALSAPVKLGTQGMRLDINEAVR